MLRFWAPRISRRTLTRCSSSGAVEADRSEGDINLTPNRREYLKRNITPETQKVLDTDARFFLHQTLSSPCMNVLEQCDGIYIIDTQGRKLMDFHGNSVHQVGFRNPDVVEALKQQLDTLPFCPRRFTNTKAVTLAQKLAELANPGKDVTEGEPDPEGLTRTLLSPGGTSGIGIALKLARIATGRFKTISMWESFHGASLDAISIGGESVFRKGVGPLLPGTSHAPPPDDKHCKFGCKSDSGGCNLRCADYVEYMLEQEGDVAAVISEPIRWTPYIPKVEYWQRIRKACDKHGALLIFDEIPNSLGRTGHMFTYQYFGVTPDIVVLGKGLGGGIVPVSAVLAKEKLNEYARTHALGHYTHEKSPLAAAAALATLKFIEQNKLVENAKTVGSYALERLREIAKNHRWISDVRGVGLLIGVELSNPDTKGRATDEAERVLYKCIEKGLSFKVTAGSVVTLCPPLIITKEQMGRAIDILDESLTELGL